MTDNDNWWNILLLVFAYHEMPEPPEYETEAVIECSQCGSEYHGDPYYAPRFCSRCGRRLMETTRIVKNPEHELWDSIKEFQALLHGTQTDVVTIKGGNYDR